MQTTIDTKQLREALQKVHLIPKNRQLPVLSYVKIDFQDNKATLLSTDMNQAITVNIDAKHDEPFTIIIPRYTLLQFLRGNNGMTTITQNDKTNTATIEREGLGKATIYTAKPEEFPPIPASQEFEWHTLDAKWFCQMLGIAILACAKEQSRPVLTGICCHNGAMATADGFRLHAIKSDKLDFGLGESEAIILFETADIVRKLFGKDETVKIGFEFTETTVGLDPKPRKAPHRVHFKSGDTYHMSELILGSYPNYHQLIPTEYACKTTFSAPLLLQRINMIDPELAGGITRFHIHQTEKDEDVCSLSARAAEFVSYDMEMPVKIEGNESKIAFNMQYILDALKPFSVCHLETTSPISPGKFTGDIEELTIVVMPMFVQW